MNFGAVVGWGPGGPREKRRSDKKAAAWRHPYRGKPQTRVHPGPGGRAGFRAGAAAADPPMRESGRRYVPVSTRQQCELWGLERGTVRLDTGVEGFN